MPDLCTAVTERSSGGPCEHTEFIEPCHRRRDALQHDEYAYAARMIPSPHAYLGPVLARCGHGEGEHHPEQQGQSCGGCVDAGLDMRYYYHEFTSGD